MKDFERKLYFRRKSKISKLKRKVFNAKKRIRNLRMLIRITIIFGLIFLSYWILTLHAWYLNPEDVEKVNPELIKVEGNLITPEYKILDLIRTAEIPNKPIYKFSTKTLEDSMSELEPVKKAYVRRFWLPARLTVYIDELTPVFLISPNEEAQPIAAITKEGKFIGREFMPIPSKFSTIKILSYGNEDDYEKWDKKRIDELLKFIRTIEAYSKEKVTYLDLRSKNDIYVMLEDELLRLGAYDDTIKDRIKWIPTILPKVRTLKQKVKYVDLRWKDAYFIKLENGEMQKTEN